MDDRPTCGSFNPIIYTHFLRCINFINIPMALLAIYFIVYKSSRAMTTYKWYLLIHIVILAFIDIQFSFFILPYLIFPVWGGMGLGLYSDFNIDVKIQFLIFMISAGLGFATTIWLFYYRSQVVLPEGHLLKHSDRGVKICMYSLLIGFQVASLHICFLLQEGESQIAMKNSYDQNLPCYMEILFDPRISVMSPQVGKYLMLFFACLSCFSIIIVLVFTIPLAFFLLSPSANISKSTRKLQWMFLKALIIQSCVTFSFCMVPVIGIMSVRGVALHRQWVNEAAFIIQNLNLSADVVTLLLCNTPYRNTIFCRKSKVKDLSTRNMDTHISVIT